MQKNTQAGQKVNIDISKSIAMKCDNEECNSDIFIPAMKFRKVPKLLTGTSTDQIIPVQIFMCVSCGNVPKEFDLNV